MFINSDIKITVTNVISANRLRKSPVGVTTYRRNRERWAVVLKLGGKTVYTVDGKQILSDALHPIILPKNSNYYWECIESGDCFIIEFEALESEYEIFSFKISDNSYIVNSFAKIEKSLNLKNKDYKLECNYLLYGILLFLSKSVKTEYVSKNKKEMMQTVIYYISENYYNCNITNDLLADICGISTVYFRKTFEKVYGVSPIKYLHNFRIKKAKAILLSDYESIEQVALSVGYNSIYHFSKMFKTYTGISPSEYAKASRK